MRKLSSILLLLFCSFIYAQQEINQYKYIIVPVQFEAFKSPNQYKTSTLIKFLLSEKGMNVVYSDKLPSEIKSNRCLAVVAELVDDSNMFTTKATVVFKDCNSVEIYRTKEGTSKLKDFNASYSEAINDALSSFSTFNYAYNGSSKESIETVTPVDIVEQAEVKSEAPIKTTDIVTVQEPKLNEVTQVNTTVTTIQKENTTVSHLYAQGITNGYQLVDSTPKIVMKLYKTSQPNIFIGEKENGVSGLLYSVNGAWYFEYYAGEELKKESLNIKF